VCLVEISLTYCLKISTFAQLVPQGGINKFAHLFMYEQLLQYLEKSQLACPFKARFGVDCMGCGFQRGLLAMYPALIPILCLFLYLVLHLRFKFKHGPYTLVALFVACIVIAFVHAVLKLT
jgi:Protein of unknown function (DUF2752)